MRKSVRGFTILEVTVFISFGLICLMCLMPGYVSARESSKDDESKSALHEIQLVVERYYVDYGEYPKYLLGGDEQGWIRWHELWDEEDPRPEEAANNWVSDLLIDDGYLSSYPKNPFITEENASEVLELTSFTDDTGPGNGDPRFGFSGDVMGCGLDDPVFFEDAHPNLPYGVVETKRTLDRGQFDTSEKGFSRRDGPMAMYPGLYYNFGGRYLAHLGEARIIYWPGNFFYRGIPYIMSARKGWSWPFPNSPTEGVLDNYILGVWGAEGNEGMDIIRLQDVSPDPDQQQIYWRQPPPWPEPSNIACGYTGRIGAPLGLPAVAGGGDAKTGPYWPPDRNPDYQGELIFGAPDGVNDGIILMLHSGEQGG